MLQATKRNSHLLKQLSVSTQYSTTLYCRSWASNLLTATYPREYGYEQTCSCQVFQQREKVVVLHCVLLVCTWMDDELVLMDAVVHGEIVVNCAALMQYACRPEQTLRPLLANLVISVLEAGLVLV